MTPRSQLARRLTVLTAALAITACASTPDRPTLVLVHGAFEDAGVWTQTANLLEANGYDTIAVNLPGRPSSGQFSAEPILELYRDTVLAAIENETNPVVLVGHSFGGMTISNVAEAAPDRIRSLVYLAAYLPRSGEALTTLSERDSASQAGPAFRIDGERGLASIAEEARAGLFCNDCPPDVAAALPSQMVDEPLVPLATPVTLSPERFGRVDKVYIRTTQDLVVSPSLQDDMLSKTPVQREIVLETGHAPFLSAPVELASAIADAVEN